MRSRFAARALAAFSVVGMSVLFLTPGVGIRSSSAFAQDNSSANKKASIELTTDPSPAQKGSNTVRVKLTDPTGKPIIGAAVTVVFFMPAMPSMNMAAMNVTAKTMDKGAGTYEGKADLPSGGMWQVTVNARQNGQPIAAKKTTIMAKGRM